MSHTPTPQYPSRSQEQSRLTPSQIRQHPLPPSEEDLSSRVSAMSIGHHQYPQSQGHLQHQGNGNAPPPPTAQPLPFSSLNTPALYGLHDYPTNLNVNVNPYYNSASAPGSAGFNNFPTFESAGNSPVATAFQYGSDHHSQAQGQGQQGMIDIYGNPQGAGRRVYGGIAPRQRGDSVSTTITNGNISTPYANGNGHGHGNYGGGGYGGHDESVPSSPMSMISGMMSQYYGYGGGENYYPPAVGGMGYRGRGKPVSVPFSLLSMAVSYCASVMCRYPLHPFNSTMPLPFMVSGPLFLSIQSLPLTSATSAPPPSLISLQRLLLHCIRPPLPFQPPPKDDLN